MPISHFVSATMDGELCKPCKDAGRPTVPATHKVGEEIPNDDPVQDRHNLTQYLCCAHFSKLMGPGTPCIEDDKKRGRGRG